METWDLGLSIMIVMIIYTDDPILDWQRLEETWYKIMLQATLFLHCFNILLSACILWRTLCTLLRTSMERVGGTPTHSNCGRQPMNKTGGGGTLSKQFSRVCWECWQDKNSFLGPQWVDVDENMRWNLGLISLHAIRYPNCYITVSKWL